MLEILDDDGVIGIIVWSGAFVIILIIAMLVGK